MDSSYSYSARDPSAERPLKNELKLFKMATICGYPGASATGLPFLHSGFHATPKSSKCYAFIPKKTDSPRTVKRADDTVVCYRSDTMFQLPGLPKAGPYPKTRPMTTRPDNGYINKNKVCFKLKGISPKQMYSVNRIRPNISAPHRYGVECLRVNSHRPSFLTELTSTDSWNLALDTIAKATLQSTQTGLVKLEGEEDVPRRKSGNKRTPTASGLKYRSSRPLGYVVSPRSMENSVHKTESPPLRNCETEP